MIASRINTISTELFVQQFVLKPFRHTDTDAQNDFENMNSLNKNFLVFEFFQGCWMEHYLSFKIHVS